MRTYITLPHLYQEEKMHQNNQTLTHEWKHCIEVCFRCAEICNECSDGMIGMEHEGDTKLMERCIRLCRECADICTMTAQWMSRVSPLALKLCNFCVEICEECAKACEQHAPEHALCGPCAEECRRCAEICLRMSGATAR
jgi:hypothetical protein